MQKWIGRCLLSFLYNNNRMYRGKTKKVKKYREEWGEAYRGGRNPFQVLANWNHPSILASLRCRLPRT